MGGDLFEQRQQGGGGSQQVGGTRHRLLIEAQAVHLLQCTHFRIKRISVKYKAKLNE